MTTPGQPLELPPVQAQQPAPALGADGTAAPPPAAHDSKTTTLVGAVLGDASAQAHREHHEVKRSHVEKADVTPEHVKDIDGADDEAPAVADGDPDRADDPGLDDLGWSEDPSVPIPVVKSIKNEELWLLIRRFNGQVAHVKKLDEPPQGGIDLNIADKDPFTPEKLKATLERLYLTIGLGLAAFVKHIARVRSWHERRRSSVFAATYTLAWVLDIVVPVFLLFTMVLLVSPRARAVLFPHAPLAAISAKTGEARVPQAGHLGSESLTGAQEAYKGEAAEMEAQNAVKSISKLAITTAVGGGAKSTDDTKALSDDSEDEHDAQEKEKGVVKKAEPLSTVTGHAVSAQTTAAGTGAEKTDAATAEAVDAGLWASMQPFLHILEDIADTWERFGNALSPTAPFRQHHARVFLAGIIAPIVLASYFISSYMVYRGTTAGVGFAFFAQPLFDRVRMSDLRKWLDKNVPDWPRYLELRNSILKGVPTNAQLTLTLLRLGEANKSPLPPPPPPDAAPEATAREGLDMADDPNLPEEYREQLRAAAAEKQAKDAQAEQEEEEKEKEKTPKKRSRIMRLFKGATAGAVETGLGANRVKATAGFESAKRKVGVVKRELGPDAQGDGPSSFHGRHRGKRGLLLISTTATTPCISFERKLPAGARAAQAAADAAKKAAPAGEETTTSRKLAQTAQNARPAPLFSIQIDDIAAVRKLGGLGIAGKLVVGWALDSVVADGLEITTTQGETFVISALPRRDEVFNRIIAMGSTKWESW